LLLQRHRVARFALVGHRAVRREAGREAAEEDGVPDRAAEVGVPVGSTVVDVFVPAVSLLCVLGAGYAFRSSWTEDLTVPVMIAGIVLCLSIGLSSYGTVKLERDLRDAMAMKEQRLREAQKMEAVGTLAGGIAHDFNNLLTGMLAGAKLLRRKAEPGSTTEEYADLLLQSTLRAAELTDRLLNLARKREAELRPVRPADVVRRVAALLRSSLPETIRVVAKLDGPELYISADPGKLEQALLNLGINAGHAMPSGGLLELEARAVTAPIPGAKGDSVVLSVRDTGVGIPEAIRERIFEPFFSTRESGEGTGLGLTMVYATVQEHGGTIDVYTQVGRGTTFSIRLPRIANEGRVDETLDTSLELAPGWETILVVDDRDGPLLAAKMILEGLGYRVFIAWSARDALRLIEEDGPIDLVLTDAVMPHMRGREFLEELRQSGYAMPVLLMSGYQATDEGYADGFAGLLRKPFEPSALARAVRKALVDSRSGKDAERIGADGRGARRDDGRLRGH
jgi:signal transduction histidine kinase/CheY-like chemotaxis protein